MSDGTRSGVNCSRTDVPPTTFASVSTARLFATPGTPSSRQCPRASRATRIRSTMWSWPTTTFFTSITVCSRRAGRSAGLLGGVMGAPGSGEPGEPGERGDGGEQQQDEAGAGDGVGDVLTGGVGDDLRADVVVDGVQLGGGRGVVRLAA